MAEVVIEPRTGHTQPEAAEQTGAGSQAPRPQPEHTGRTGAGSQPVASPATGRHCHNQVAVSFFIQFFCITPILAFFNSFLGLSRHLSRLDNPKKLLHDNEGSG